MQCLKPCLPSRPQKTGSSSDSWERSWGPAVGTPSVGPAPPLFPCSPPTPHPVLSPSCLPASHRLELALDAGGCGALEAAPAEGESAGWAGLSPWSAVPCLLRPLQMVVQEDYPDAPSSQMPFPKLDPLSPPSALRASQRLYVGLVVLPSVNDCSL